jgi:hypothetical protein
LFQDRFEVQRSNACCLPFSCHCPAWHLCTNNTMASILRLIRAPYSLNNSNRTCFSLSSIRLSDITNCWTLELVLLKSYYITILSSWTTSGSSISLCCKCIWTLQRFKAYPYLRRKAATPVPMPR